MNAEGGDSRYDGATAKTYHVGATASWELDIFGKLTAAKRGAFATLQGSRDYQQAVQTQLIATIADSYYTLVVLDAQRTINNRTLENWRATVRTLEALKKVGKANEAGVLQAKANVMQLESSQLAICKSISETENALSAILAMPSQSIERSSLTEASFPDTISIGVPLQLLSNRPDVRQAEMELAQAFYATHAARSAFYPNITLSGTLGWTNNGGGAITNPGQWLFNAIGSLTLSLARLKTDPSFKDSLAYLKKHLNYRDSTYPFYFEYYMSQALFHADQEVWKEWNYKNMRYLGASQAPNGSWLSDHSAAYSTSAALLSLALNYRFLPIYEQ